MSSPSKTEAPALPLWGALLICAVGLVGVYVALSVAASVRALAHGGLVSASFRAVARDPVTLGCAQLVGAGLALGFGLYVFARGLPLRDALGIEPISPLTVALAAVAGFALQFPLAELANVLREFQPMPMDEQIAQRAMLDPPDPVARFGVVLAAVGMAPLGEELVFRGFLLRLLDARYGRVIAIVATALLFGMVHVSPVAIAYASIAGLYLALVVHATGSTLAALVVHATNNAVPIVLSSHVVTIRGLNTIGEVHHLPWWVVTATALVAFAALLSMWRSRPATAIDE